MSLRVVVFLGVLFSVRLVSADTLKLIVATDPAGATLYANDAGQLMGYAPYELKYELAKGFFKGSACAMVQGLRVRWASGAEAAVPSLTVCPWIGKRQQFVFTRPTGVSGGELDAEFALRLQELALAQQQSRAEAIADLYRYYDAKREARRAERARRLSCRSVIFGNIIRTDCY
jgi:hypothetical protein